MQVAAITETTRRPGSRDVFELGLMLGARGGRIGARGRTGRGYVSLLIAYDGPASTAGCCRGLHHTRWLSQQSELKATVVSRSDMSITAFMAADVRACDRLAHARMLNRYELQIGPEHNPAIHQTIHRSEFPDTAVWFLAWVLYQVPPSAE